MNNSLCSPAKAAPLVAPLAVITSGRTLTASIVSAGAILFLTSLAACSGMSNRGENTAVGAGAGAVAGAVLTGGSGVGTVGGAVVGGVIGNSVEKK